MNQPLRDPENIPHQACWKGPLCMLLLIIFALVLVFANTSCTMRWDGNGQRSVTVDGMQFWRAVEIISQK